MENWTTCHPRYVSIQQFNMNYTTPYGGIPVSIQSPLFHITQGYQTIERGETGVCVTWWKLHLTKLFHAHLVTKILKSLR